MPAPDHGPLGGTPVIGWREWVALPLLGLPALRAKTDTGATTSALQATDLEPFAHGGAPHVRFRVHPFLRRLSFEVVCEAPVVDERRVTSSSGHDEKRVVIGTALRLGIRVGAPEWPIEITLTDRREMRYPMLLGREAMTGRLLVDPGAEFLLGRPGAPRELYK